jgi:hypothetical protein
VLLESLGLTIKSVVGQPDLFLIAGSEQQDGGVLLLNRRQKSPIVSVPIRRNRGVAWRAAQYYFHPDRFQAAKGNLLLAPIKRFSVSPLVSENYLFRAYEQAVIFNALNSGDSFNYLEFRSAPQVWGAKEVVISNQAGSRIDQVRAGGNQLDATSLRLIKARLNWNQLDETYSSEVKTLWPFQSQSSLNWLGGETFDQLSRLTVWIPEPQRLPAVSYKTALSALEMAGIPVKMVDLLSDDLDSLYVDLEQGGDKSTPTDTIKELVLNRDLSRLTAQRDSDWRGFFDPRLKLVLLQARSTGALANLTSWTKIDYPLSSSGELDSSDTATDEGGDTTSCLLNHLIRPSSSSGRLSGSNYPPCLDRSQLLRWILSAKLFLIPVQASQPNQD